MRLSALALGLPLWVGCATRYDPCFAPPTEVSGMQFLSVSPSPPQARWAADGTVEPTSFHVLIGDPLHNGESIAVDGDLCPIDGNGPCERFTASGSSDGMMSFSVLPSPALMRAAVSGDPLHGFDSVRLKMTLRAESPTAAEQSEKLLVFARPGETPNAPFSIVGIEVHRLVHTYREVYGPGITYPPDDEVLSPGATLRLDVGDPVWLRPIVSAGAAEEYETTNLSGQRVTLREQITYSFHSTEHMVFGYETGGEPDPGSASALPGLTYVTHLRVRGGGGNVWIVARDSRGAQTWVTLPITATDSRFCLRSGSPCALLEVACR